MRTREEHLQWCKQRALEYLERGQVKEALTSMFSDLDKHEETRDHKGIAIGVQLMMIGSLNSPQRAREFILGFN